jgi:hypothetical protein
MDNPYVRVYALLVCFFSIICLTISTGMGLYELVKIADPELTLSPYRYQHLESDASYRRLNYPAGVINPAYPSMPKHDESISKMTAEKIAEAREKERDNLIAAERKQAIASLIRLFIVIIVTSPVFYIHWRIAGKPLPAL